MPQVNIRGCCLPLYSASEPPSFRHCLTPPWLFMLACARSLASSWRLWTLRHRRFKPSLRRQIHQTRHHFLFKKLSAWMTHVTQTTPLSSASTTIMWIVDTKLHLGMIFSQFQVGHVDCVFAVNVIVFDERERWELFVVVIIIFTDEQSRSISQKLMLGMITAVTTFATASWNTWEY